MVLDVLPLVISGLALISTAALAWRNDGRLKRAEKKISKLPWSELVESVMMAMPASDEKPDYGRLQVVSVKAEQLSEETRDWPELSPWVQAELDMGMTLRFHLLDAIENDPRSKAEYEARAYFGDWCVAFCQNLRRFQDLGRNTKTLSTLDLLTEKANKTTTAVRSAHRWPEPGSDSRIVPLEEEDSTLSKSWRWLPRRRGRRR